MRAILALAVSTTLVASGAPPVLSQSQSQPMPARPQGQCSEYLGKTIEPEAFAKVAEELCAIGPMGEFETTAQYQERLKKAAPRGLRIIGKAIEDTKYLQYDADAGVLKVQAFALQNKGFGFKDAFSVSKAGVKAETSGNVAVVIESVDTPTGTYEAQNAYGAKVQVLRVTRTVAAIFDRGASTSFAYEPLFRDTLADSQIDRLKMSPAEAQAERPKLRAAFVVQLKAPYFVRGEMKPYDVTIRNPRDITEKFQVIFADIRCGLLLKGDGKVIGAYLTN
jgi:hypothetical protein